MIARKILVVLLGLLIIIPSALLRAEEPVTFAEFADHLDLLKRTQLHADNFWSKHVGQEATWSGKVVSVKGGRGGKAEVLIANHERPLFKGYNIVLDSYDIDNAANLQIGQEVSFKGALRKVKNKRGQHLVIVYLDSVEFITTPPEE